MDTRDARETLKKIKFCAIEAGIYEHWFLTFGTLLGAIRPSPMVWGDGFKYERGIIEYDDDMDVGILADKITVEQEHKYIEAIRKAGLFGWNPDTKRPIREKYQHRDDTGRVLWFSLRGSLPPRGTKCCNWFWQKYHGYYWHSKGHDWTNQNKGKFRQAKVKHSGEDAAIMLGIPENYLNDLMEIELYGEKYNIPVMYGHCIDFWYPNWIEPKKKATSAKKIHCVIGDWADESTWRIC